MGSEEATATETRMRGIQREDFRRLRAAYMTDAIMREIRPMLQDDSHGSAHDLLFDLFYSNGAAWTTDEEREKMGFEPRDEFGWTPSERVRAEEEKRAMLLKLFVTDPVTMS